MTRDGAAKAAATWSDAERLPHAYFLQEHFLRRTI